MAQSIIILTGQSNMCYSAEAITAQDLQPHCPAGGVHWCPEVYPEIAARFVEAFR